jgi:hypothetical protein
MEIAIVAQTTKDFFVLDFNTLLNPLPTTPIVVSSSPADTAPSARHHPQTLLLHMLPTLLRDAATFAIAASLLRSFRFAITACLPACLPACLSSMRSTSSPGPLPAFMSMSCSERSSSSSSSTEAISKQHPPPPPRARTHARPGALLLPIPRRSQPAASCRARPIT